MIFLILLALTIAFFVWLYQDQHRPSQNAAKPEIDIDALHKEAEMIKLRVEVMIQSEIVGDTATHDAVVNDTYDGPWPELRADGSFLSLYDNLRIFKIAGINYCDRINRYRGQCMCALVPDPKNEFDPNAIKIVAEDGHKIGFIPSNQTDFVRSLTGEQFPYRCTAQIQELEDGDDRTFFDGKIYIKRYEKDQGQ